MNPNVIMQKQLDELAATRKIIELGLELIAQDAPRLSSEAIHAWLLGSEDAPFPEPDIFG